VVVDGLLGHGGFLGVSTAVKLPLSPQKICDSVFDDANLFSFELIMKKTKKTKNFWLKETEIEVGYLYFTMANQYRAVLAMKGDFLIYAPSSENMQSLSPNANMPFDNSPFKKCQLATFAKKDYQVFAFNGTDAIKHKLNESQIAEATTQCNAKAAIAALLAE
jgi:hypothetical protein